MGGTMKSLTRHKRRLLRYRRRGITIFTTLRLPDGTYSYGFVDQKYFRYDARILDFGQLELRISADHWRKADRLQAGYRGISAGLSEVLDAQAGLKSVVARAHEGVEELHAALEAQILDDRYFEPPCEDNPFVGMPEED